jgi:hypothetical protein
MPYYIYHVSDFPIRQLKKLEQHDVYKAASSRVKQLRAELSEGSPMMIKMIHAESELHAEDLLNQVRDPVHITEDD